VLKCRARELLAHLGLEFCAIDPAVVRALQFERSLGHDPLLMLKSVPTFTGSATEGRGERPGSGLPLRTSKSAGAELREAEIVLAHLSGWFSTQGAALGARDAEPVEYRAGAILSSSR